MATLVRLAIALAILGLFASGCASLGRSAYLSQAEEALASGDDIRAFTNYAYAMASRNEAAAQAALAAVRGSPRLLAAMEGSLEQVRNTTAIGVDTREEYLRDLSRRSEVQAFFLVRQIEARQREEFFETAWNRASMLIEKSRAERLAAERKKAAEEEAARARERAALAVLIAEAAAGSRVTCASELECRKAFALAQIYVSTKTDMKIQLATDTIIETYNPTEAGKMGAKVIKTPGAGQSAEIVLTVSCRECLPRTSRSSLELMKEFRPFVEARLKQ